MRGFQNPIVECFLTTLYILTLWGRLLSPSRGRGWPRGGSRGGRCPGHTVPSVYEVS